MADKCMEEFDKIYNQYFKDVYLFILKLSNDAKLSEEITQETFFKAMNSIESFKGNCKVSVWLCQIAKNTYFTYLNKQKRYIDNSSIENDYILSFEDELLNKENRFYIHKILHDLEEPYKEVFTLRVFGELSYLDIGRLFDKTENWARVIFYRAKNKIRDKFEEVNNE